MNDATHDEILEAEVNRARTVHAIAIVNRELAGESTTLRERLNRREAVERSLLAAEQEIAVRAPQLA